MNNLESNSQERQQSDSDSKQFDYFKGSHNQKIEYGSSDPIVRFKNLNADQLKMKLKQLEFDKKKMSLDTMRAKMKVKIQESRIQKFRAKVTQKQLVIDNQKRYMAKLEEQLKSIQFQISDFSKISEQIENTLNSKQDSLDDKFNTLIDDKSDEENSESKSLRYNADIAQPFKQKQIISNSRNGANHVRKIYNNVNEVPSEESSYSKDDLQNSCPYNRGQWTEKEKLKYGQFVVENRDILDKSELCYHYRIYRQMSNYLGSRSIKQCRTYHKQIQKGKRHTNSF